MWLYARRLTGSASGGVLAGIAFSFVPFRFDHFQHLELQATMFMPLTLWCLVRAFDSGERRDVWGAIACLVAQVYCGIYYAVFLVTALLIVIPLHLGALPVERRKALVRASVPALAIGALAVAPYLAVYVMNRGIVGERSDREVLRVFGDRAKLPGLAEGEPRSRLVERRLRSIGAAAVPRSDRGRTAGVGLVGIDRRRAALACMGLVGLILSLG